ncbi:ribosomal protein S7 [Delitschia confertaspora ATCC 74209]|uniref:Small ribosomal subunit protein uS7m n=1 Tax=Delitschia confertaspora ATCC 74209 TaxID=1513339 RepID=A0A9P4JGG3_9PLEO|nr:ribosomal protein S7 [Delitschia confertaspora ATCC 74209]
MQKNPAPGVISSKSTPTPSDMPPRLNVLSLTRGIPFRPKPQTPWRFQPSTPVVPVQYRAFADARDGSKGADSTPLPHVTEEAAKIAKIEGKSGPDLEQGTPVAEIVKGDKAAQENLPKVMQDKLRAKTSGTSAPKGSRSFSTATTPTTQDGGDLGLLSFDATATQPAVPGVKFGLPVLPIPKDGHLKHRYDPVVDQVTKLLMRHGELSVAQRNMSLILNHLRTAPVPTINPSRPLVPGAPPPSHLPLNPILYLTLAIDSVAPLLRIRSQKGAAGGGVALQIPVPLGQRQRRRTAIQWILTSASRRKTTASGKGGFAQRVAQELISVVEGKSSVWERRNAVHKLGVAARANIVVPRKR